MSLEVSFPTSLDVGAEHEWVLTLWAQENGSIHSLGVIVIVFFPFGWVVGFGWTFPPFKKLGELV